MQDHILRRDPLVFQIQFSTACHLKGTAIVDFLFFFIVFLTPMAI